jgi:hypothetical protein
MRDAAAVTDSTRRFSKEQSFSKLPAQYRSAVIPVANTAMATQTSGNVKPYFE